MRDDEKIAVLENRCKKLTHVVGTLAAWIQPVIGDQGVSQLLEMLNAKTPAFDMSIIESILNMVEVWPEDYAYNPEYYAHTSEGKKVDAPHFRILTKANQSKCQHSLWASIEYFGILPDWNGESFTPADEFLQKKNVPSEVVDFIFDPVWGSDKAHLVQRLNAVIKLDLASVKRNENSARQRMLLNEFIDYVKGLD